MSGYRCFANYYDRLTDNVEYKKRADYFRTLLSASGISGGILVDLACGTGSLLFEMAAFGYDAIGIDSSPEMLSIAQSKMPEEGKKPLLLCQDMRTLDLYGTVDAVICSLDSINHLTKPEDVKETFKRVSLFLNPGGIFIFDVNTIYKHEKVLADNAFVFDFDDLYCVWQNRTDTTTGIVDITLDFFEEDNGAYYRSTENFAERAYSFDDLGAWLKEAGLEVKSIYEELKQTPPAETAQRAVFVAGKAR